MSDAASSIPTFHTTPYKPDNGYTLSGLLILLASLAAFGALLGYIAFWVHKAFWFVLLFPAVIGFAIGALGIRMVTSGHIRNRWLGGLAGFLAGALAMFAMHYFEYDAFKSDTSIISAEMRRMAQLPDAELEKIAAEIRDPQSRENFRETMAVARIDFRQYMDLKANAGVSIKGHGSPMHLNYTGSYIYWAIEVLIVAGITFGMVVDTASQPYCANCARWKTARVLGFLAGKPKKIAAALDRGDLATIDATRRSHLPRDIQVTVACCDACAGRGTIDVRLDHVIPTKDGSKSKFLTHVTYPTDALPHIATLFAPPITPQTLAAAGDNTVTS